MLLQVWTNFRRKSTEGFSPYTTIASIFGGAFSVLQMLLLAYNYGKSTLMNLQLYTAQMNYTLHADDWKSIFGDPTKFGFGLITLGFEVVHFCQHYVLYRAAWMRTYKLNMNCTCAELDCKHEIKAHEFVALPQMKVILKRVNYYV